MRKRLFVLLLALALAIQSTGCGGTAQTAGDSLQGSENAGERETDEEQVRLEDDYYEYINKDLLEQIELEATNPHWDWFTELDAVANAEMEEIIRNLSEDNTVYEKGSSEQKIRDLFECVSDTANRNETGLGPLAPHMDRIRKARSIEEYVDALAYLSAEFGFSSIVGGYSIMQDKADSDQYAVYLMYADTLVGKEYIEGEETQEYVGLYMDYVKDMLCEFGMEEPRAQRSADSIEKLLRDICASTLTLEQLYDPTKTVHYIVRV